MLDDNVLTPRINNIVNGSSWRVGDVKHSFLTEAQFQAEHDNTWQLCQGQSIAGTDLATVTGWTNAPDARGQFLRAKNNSRVDGNENPDGDLALGAYQADQFLSHTHTYERHTVTGGGSGPGLNQALGTLSTGAAGGNETRSKNITVNMYIKINREPTI